MVRRAPLSVVFLSSVLVCFGIATAARAQEPAPSPVLQVADREGSSAGAPALFPISSDERIARLADKNPLFPALPALEEGDIIFLGWNAVSLIGVAGRWSGPDYEFQHLGVFVHGPEGQPAVVHAAGSLLNPDGPVKASALREFIGQAARVGVFRPRDPQLAARMAAAAKALPVRKLNFDAAFSLKSETELYCTELVWRVMNEALGHDFYPDKPTIIGRLAVPFTAFETTPLLREVAFLTAAPPARRTLQSRRAASGAADESSDGPVQRTAAPLQ
jgi:hypothetical protein